MCMLCAYTRPRYQVSVYRTIGPLVFLLLRQDMGSDSISLLIVLPDAAKNRSLSPRRLHIKFGFDWASGFGKEDV